MSAHEGRPSGSDSTRRSRISRYYLIAALLVVPWFYLIGAYTEGGRDFLGGRGGPRGNNRAGSDGRRGSCPAFP
jgi:hypothetical protein